MDREEQQRILKEIELSYPVGTWQINNIHIWPILRRLIAAEVSEQKTSVSVRKQIVEENHDIILTDLLKREYDAIFLTNYTYKANLNEVWYDRICDPIIESLNKIGIKSLSLLPQPKQIESQKFFSNNVNTYSYFLKLPLDRYIKTHHNTLDGFFDLLEYLETKLSIKSISYQRIVDTVSQIRDKADFYRMILKSAKAKIGLMVCYYREDGYAFSLACHELSIPSVDIQHGVQGEYHFAYGGWNNVPDEGYNILPSAFWCWSEYEQSFISKWGKRYHQSFVGGNGWLDMWMSSDFQLSNQYNDIINKSTENGQIKIIMTLQPLYGLPGWDHNIPQWVIDAIKECPENWRFYIRSHPQMVSGNYRNELESTIEQLKSNGILDKVEIDLATNLPLPALLQVMDVHITAFSTCVLEAEYFGIASVIIHKTGCSYYKDQVESGKVLPAFNKQQLIYSISEQYKKKDISKMGVDQSRIVNTFQDIITSFASRSQVTNEYDSEVFNEIAYIQMLFIDKKYQLIIDLYGDRDDPIIIRYVGKSYEMLGDLNKSASNSRKYIDRLSSIGLYERDTEFHLAELVTIEQNSKLDNNYYDKIKKLISGPVTQGCNLGVVLQKLFADKKYKEIKSLTLSLKAIEHLDVLFFSGRAFKLLNDRETAILQLKKYVQMYSNNNTLIDYCTYKHNYLVSAFFYLGECYMGAPDQRELAIHNFKTCVELSDGKHQKAKEYISKLDGSVSKT